MKWNLITLNAIIFVGFCSCLCFCLRNHSFIQYTFRFTIFRNNRVVTESSFARPIPLTPRFDKRRDKIFWSSSRSKAAFPFGSNSSLPLHDSPSQPLTSSPVTNQGEGSDVRPACDLSVIRGELQLITFNQSEGQQKQENVFEFVNYTFLFLICSFS